MFSLTSDYYCEFCALYWENKYILCISTPKKYKTAFNFANRWSYNNSMFYLDKITKTCLSHLLIWWLFEVSKSLLWTFIVKEIKGSRKQILWTNVSNALRSKLVCDVFSPSLNNLKQKVEHINPQSCIYCDASPCLFISMLVLFVSFCFYFLPLLDRKIK